MKYLLLTFILLAGCSGEEEYRVDACGEYCKMVKTCELSDPLFNCKHEYATLRCPDNIPVVECGFNEECSDFIACVNKNIESEK